MLIKCIECGKEISSKASACPNCGCPVSIQNVQESQLEDDGLICPEFPKDLSLGESLVVKDLSYSASGYYDNSINNIQNFIDGQTIIALFKNGVKIINNNKQLDIHKSQIISLEEFTEEQIITKDKSVIGRAIIGGILTGGVGAIVGGISGVGSKQKKVEKFYFIINYWDIETRKLVSFILNTKDSNSRFINKFKEDALNK